MTAFEEAEAALASVQELMEGVDIPSKSDPASGSITIGTCIVHLQDAGLQHVTAGIPIIHSGTNPAEAVIEAVVHTISDRTRQVLRSALLR